MIFGSLCSGIEAASVAWAPLGWRCAFVSEIDRNARKVLAHHYPDVPNHGDMTKFKEWPDHAIDLLAGGTPCQSFSVAGLRKGLDDPRGNLMLTYLAIAARYRPRWLVWENVPGVLSSGGGRDFGAFLGGLAELGYGFAYRVLDAQYVRVHSHPGAVPQRRRRVFVVGHLADWRRAAAVLLERQSLQGHSPPRREAGQAAPTLPSRSTAGGGLGTDFDCDGGLIPEIVGALSDGAHNGGGLDGQDAYSGRIIPVAHALRGEGFDASEDGTGRGTPIIPVAFSSKDHGADALSGVAPTLWAMGHDRSHSNGGGQLAIAFDTTQLTSKANYSNPQPGDPCHPLAAAAHPPAIATPWSVRRLTPLECTRLQGFPDDYFDGLGLKDGPIFKMLGNSMAVNVMSWIGQRIAMVEALA